MILRLQRESKCLRFKAASQAKLLKHKLNDKGHDAHALRVRFSRFARGHLVTLSIISLARVNHDRVQHFLPINLKVRTLEDKASWAYKSRANLPRPGTDQETHHNLIAKRAVFLYFRAICAIFLKRANITLQWDHSCNTHFMRVT